MRAERPPPIASDPHPRKSFTGKAEHRQRAGAATYSVVQPQGPELEKATKGTACGKCLETHRDLISTNFLLSPQGEARSKEATCHQTAAGWMGHLVDYNRDSMP